MKKITYVKLALDMLMAVTFVLLFNKRVLGGLTFHEIAGLAISAAFITHILLNVQWVIKVTRRLLDRKLPGKTRFGYLLNLLLLLCMTFIIVSGILISEVVFPGIHVASELWFKLSHITISFLTLILIGIHVGLHWHWVIHVMENIVKVKSYKAAIGRMAKIMTILLFLYGGYQMYTTHFVSRIEGLGIVFQLTEPGAPPAGVKPRPDHPEAAQGSAEDRPARPEGAPEGRMEGGFQAPSALGVILTYFGIMGVFIILTYYMEKLAARKKLKAA